MNVHDQDCLLQSITRGSIHWGFKSPDEKSAVQWEKSFWSKRVQRKMRDPHFKILSKPNWWTLSVYICMRTTAHTLSVQLKVTYFILQLWGSILISPLKWARPCCCNYAPHQPDIFFGLISITFLNTNVIAAVRFIYFLYLRVRARLRASQLIFGDQSAIS